MEISVTVLIDGARPDVIAHLLKGNELPNVKEIVDSGSFNTATSTFPTTTGCAHLPFIAGKFPGDCNVPGVRWWQDGTTRSYFTFGKNLNHDTEAKLIYDEVRSACIFSPISRGAEYRLHPLGIPVCHVTNNWLFFDKMGFKVANRALERKKYQFLFLCLYSIDELGHRIGRNSAAVLNAYQVLDKKIGELKKTLDKNYDDYQLFLVSDHGLTDTHTHIDLVKMISSLGFSVRSYPFSLNLKQDVFVGESGNSMANVYLTKGHGDREKDLDSISEKLTGAGGIDLVLHKNEGIHVFKGDAEGIVDRKNGKFRYECVRGDPLSLQQYSGEWLNDKKWHSLTFDTQYPDSIVQICQIFNSARAGDLIVTAENGCDLRTFEIPEHKASHGSLNKEHMLVPVISNKDVHIRRTTDIFDVNMDYLLGK